MKNVLIFLTLLFFQYGYSQQVDSVGNNQQMKPTVDEGLISKANFFAKYGMEGRKPLMARVTDEFELRTEPSCSSALTGVFVPTDSIVYVYKYFPEEKCWATQFQGKWGFITDSKVFPISKRTRKVSKYDIPPKLKTKIAPKYPKEARKKGIKGKVYIKIYIDETGKATKTIILKGFPELNQAAIDAVKKAKYKPAIYKDKKVGVWVTLFLDFK
jgi:TonB family protein